MFFSLREKLNICWILDYYKEILNLWVSKFSWTSTAMSATKNTPFLVRICEHHQCKEKKKANLLFGCAGKVEVIQLTLRPLLVTGRYYMAYTHDDMEIGYEESICTPINIPITQEGCRCSQCFGKAAS